LIDNQHMINLLRTIALLFTTSLKSGNSIQPSQINRSCRMNLAASSSTTSMGAASQLKVCVIGSGAAGLVTARVLKRNGIQPLVLEQDSEFGGVWTYEANSKKKPMYKGLRTNLPREIMAFRELPWGGDGTTRSFVTHKEVKNYLSRYAKAMDVENLIQYKSTVTQLEVLNDNENQNQQIKLSWEQPGSKNDKQNKEQTTYSDIFDAVCVCNGHYAVSAESTIDGIDTFEGEVYHSIRYDDPSIFKNKNVLCVGGRASGSDLAREISHYANKVYLSDTNCPNLIDGNPIREGNVLWVPRTVEVLTKRVSFGSECKEKPEIDVIILCNGYAYQFPFINERSNLDDFSAVPGERRVKPLFEQLWHPTYPLLTFIGLQHSVVPFPFYELQAEAVVKQLIFKSKSSSCDFPQLQERIADAERDASSGGPNGGRIQDTHFLGEHQWNACLKYAKYAGLCDDDLKKYIMTNKAIYDHSGKERKGLFPGGPDTYRFNSYVRDDENESFQVYSLLHEMQDEETRKQSLTGKTVS